MKVHVLGNATVYPDRGQLQLVIKEVRAAGMGDLQARFLELKEKLQREGLFDAEEKKPFPPFPAPSASSPPPPEPSSRTCATCWSAAPPG